jgi:hypothetical protein
MPPTTGSYSFYVTADDAAYLNGTYFDVSASSSTSAVPAPKTSAVLGVLQAAGCMQYAVLPASCCLLPAAWALKGSGQLTSSARPDHPTPSPPSPSLLPIKS